MANTQDSDVSKTLVTELKVKLDNLENYELK